MSEQEQEVQAEPEVDPETGGEVEAPEPGPDDETPEPEPEPEPEDEESSLTVTMEQDAARSRVEKYLNGNKVAMVGDDADNYAECPYCRATGTPGFMRLGPIPDELHGLTYQLLNMRAPAELMKDNYSRACDECAGEGQTRTGSKVAGQETLPCIGCLGKGWIAVGDERQGGLFSVPNGPMAANVPPADSSEPMFVPPANEPPEAAALRAQGYVLVPPMHAAG